MMDTDLAIFIALFVGFIFGDYLHRDRISKDVETYTYEKRWYGWKKVPIKRR